jgi:hypothetical protein
MGACPFNLSSSYQPGYFRSPHLRVIVLELTYVVAMGMVSSAKSFNTRQCSRYLLLYPNSFHSSRSAPPFCLLTEIDPSDVQAWSAGFSRYTLIWTWMLFVANGIFTLSILFQIQYVQSGQDPGMDVYYSPAARHVLVSRSGQDTFAILSDISSSPHSYLGLESSCL